MLYESIQNTMNNWGAWKSKTICFGVFKLKLKEISLWHDEISDSPFSHSFTAPNIRAPPIKYLRITEMDFVYSISVVVEQ